MKNIYLVCGSGASSGFMAAAIRKAAKKLKLEYTAKATSESQLADNLDNVDVILVGPHIAYKEESIKEIADGKGIKVGVLPQDIYGTLDGEKAIKFIESL